MYLCIYVCVYGLGGGPLAGRPFFLYMPFSHIHVPLSHDPKYFMLFVCESYLVCIYVYMYVCMVWGVDPWLVDPSSCICHFRIFTCLSPMIQSTLCCLFV